MKGMVLACLVSLSGGAALAHPHVFVDTGLRLSLDDSGALTEIEVTWTYDDFFTLLIFEDMGLDPDGDAQLTEAELARLRGFDLEVWPEGFEGDLYIYSNGEKLSLAHPVATGIEVVDGRIRATHVRSVPSRPAATLEILQYDPTYYVAYDVTGGVTVDGGSCKPRVADPDLDAAAEAVAQELQTMPEDMFEIMEVGIHYADRITLECNGSS